MRRLGGRFVLEREIGSGGMSTVFLGNDEILDRPVAVKVLKPGFEDHDVGARFRREGRTAARLSHPNVVQVYDAQEGELDGRETSYIVMEHVSGGDLKDLILARGPLAEREISRIGAEVAAGLAHAHERGIVHRDVKPQNILLDEYGRPKITDFGIARALDTTQATQTGSYLGTATYSSPEQLRGERVTTKSDIYSLGATLYEAAAGEPPFLGAPIAIAGQQLSKDPEPLRQRAREGVAPVSEEFEALVMAALSKEPANRPDAATISEKLLQESVPATVSQTAPVADALLKTLSGAGAAGVAGISRVMKGAKSLGAAGASAAGEAARRIRDRSSRGAPGDDSPPQTIITTQTFRAGPRPALLVVAAALVLLLVVGGISLFFVSSGEEPAANASKSNDASKAVDASKEDKKSDRAKPEAEIGSGKLTQAAAVDVVANTYLDVIQENYKGSYASLSKDLKENEYPSRSDWEGKMKSLEALKFTDGPVPELGKNDTTVKGTVQSIYTAPNRLEQADGTWTLVPVNGEWRISAIDFTNKQTQKL